jgi:hypothetical protein
MLPQPLGLDFTEIITGDKVMGTKGGPWRKIPSFLWPPILEKNVTIPAIEKEVSRSQQGTRGSTKINGYPFPGMKSVGKGKKEGLLCFVHSISLYKK